MSIIGDIVGTVASVAVHAVIDTVCPEAELIPGLTNMVSNMVGDMLGQAVDQAMQQSGAPQFQINDVLDLIKQAVQSQQQPCDNSWQDQIKNQYGGLAQNMISDFISDFLQKLKAECGHGGKGHGGAGGSGTGGAVTLRDLAAALGKLEEEEAARLKKKVDDASASLADDKQNQQSKGSGAPSDDQFSKMEAVKAESQIQATLSSMVSEVLKNFGQSLQSSGRS